MCCLSALCGRSLQMTLPTHIVRVTTFYLHREYTIVWVERICERLLISFRNSPDYTLQSVSTKRVYVLGREHTR
jgi:hypothetical protein